MGNGMKGKAGKETYRADKRNGNKGMKERATQQGVQRLEWVRRQRALAPTPRGHTQPRKKKYPLSLRSLLLLFCFRLFSVVVPFLFLPRLLWLVARLLPVCMPQRQSTPGCKVRPMPSHKQAECCHSALVTAPVWPFQGRYSHSTC